MIKYQDNLSNSKTEIFSLMDLKTLKHKSIDYINSY